MRDEGESKDLITMRQYCVYILASISGVLYIGVTNNLKRRVYEHKHKTVEGFTKKYNVNKLYILNRPKM